MIVEGERTFDAPRATVWQVLNDPASMAATMPGVESFDVHDAQRWTANVKIPLGLGGLKMKIDMEKTEEREPEFAAMSIKAELRLFTTSFGSPALKYRPRPFTAACQRSSILVGSPPLVLTVGLGQFFVP